MPEGARDFVFSSNRQTGSEAHGISPSMAPGLFPEVKQPGCEESDDSPPCTR